MALHPNMTPACSNNDEDFTLLENYIAGLKPEESILVRVLCVRMLAACRSYTKGCPAGGQLLLPHA